MTKIDYTHKIKKITIKDSKKIAKSVLTLLHRVDPRTIVFLQIRGK